MIKTLGTLNILPISSNLNLVAESTANYLKNIENIDEGVGVAEVDTNFSDTAAFCEHYQVSLGQTVNCVIIKATRGDKNWYAVCVLFGDSRADVNGAVRRHLNARKVSFAPMDETVLLTKMEYGGITPIGLPEDWPILLDKRVVDSDVVVIGGGIRKSKIITSGKFISSLKNAVVLAGMTIIKTQNN